jgi:hypothetical protein
MQFDAGFHLDGAGQETAGWYDHPAATFFMSSVDGRLYDRRVQGLAIGLGAEVQDVVVLSKEKIWTKKDQTKE